MSALLAVDMVDRDKSHNGTERDTQTPHKRGTLSNKQQLGTG